MFRDAREARERIDVALEYAACFHEQMEDYEDVERRQEEAKARVKNETCHNVQNVHV